jgi:hypothetical protein
MMTTLAMEHRWRIEAVERAIAADRRVKDLAERGADGEEVQAAAEERATWVAQAIACGATINAMADLMRVPRARIKEWIR